METHKVTGPEDLYKLGMSSCEYSQELFYGPLHDRVRISGAYINPLTRKIEVVRIMTGKTLFNQSFSQYISTEKIIWNLPDWQKISPGGDMNIEIGDKINIYVAAGREMKKMENFYAGEFSVKEIYRGRPTKITLIARQRDNIQGGYTPSLEQCQGGMTNLGNTKHLNS